MNTAPATRQAPAPVASTGHTLGFLGIVAASVAAGYAAQHRQVAGGGLAESHTHVIPLYLSVTVMNWLLVAFAWKGIRAQGGRFGDIVGGRWARGREVLRDLGLAALFWALMLGAAWALDRGLGPGTEKSLSILLPRTPLEVGVWLLTSASAGFCEEFVFRGYLQRQLLALGGRAWAAVLGQGIVFGLMHAYQGWRPVLHISVIGVLFGTLAAWRGSLRVGMLAHGWHDFWAGWLGRVLLR